MSFSNFWMSINSAYTAAGPVLVSSYLPEKSQNLPQQSQYGMQHLKDRQLPPDRAPAMKKLRHDHFSLPQIAPSSIKPLPDHFRNLNPALYGATGSHQQHPLYRTSSKPPLVLCWCRCILFKRSLSIFYFCSLSDNSYGYCPPKAFDLSKSYAPRSTVFSAVIEFTKSL